MPVCSANRIEASPWCRSRAMLAEEVFRHYFTKSANSASTTAAGTPWISRIAGVSHPRETLLIRLSACHQYNCIAGFMRQRGQVRETHLLDGLSEGGANTIPLLAGDYLCRFIRITRVIP